MVNRSTFVSDPATRFYRPLLGSHPDAFECLFALLNDSENEQCLINAATDARPALDGVVVHIEADPVIRAVLDSDSDSHPFRKAVGVVVRQKMEELGWRKDREETLNLKNSTIFESSQLYIPNPEWTADGTTSC